MSREFKKEFAETLVTPIQPTPDPVSLLSADQAGGEVDIPPSILLMQQTLILIANFDNSHIDGNSLVFSTMFSRDDDAFAMSMVPSLKGIPFEDARDDPDLYDAMVAILNKLYVYAPDNLRVEPENLYIEADNKLALFTAIDDYLGAHESIKTQETFGFNTDPQIASQQLKEVYRVAVRLTEEIDQNTKDYLFAHMECRPLIDMDHFKAQMTFINAVQVPIAMGHILKTIVQEDRLSPDLAETRGYIYGGTN